MKISTKGRYALRIDVKKMNIDSLSMSAEETLKLTNKDVVNELGGLPPVKLHCSVLAEEAIHEAIADYYRKQGKYSEEEIKKICNLKEHKCEHCA